MTNESRENLSSFMDGEIDKESARFLVRRLASDEQMRGSWARYHLIRDCMRHQDGGLVASDLQARVHDALAAEPAPVAAARSGWRRAAVGSAIAASVALAAVMVVAPDNAPVSQPGAEVLSQQPAAAAFVSPNIGNTVRSSQPVNLSGTEDGAGRAIDPYLLRHYQVTGGAGGRGFVSFVPIVVTTQGVAGQDAAAPAPDAESPPAVGEETAGQ